MCFGRQGGGQVVSMLAFYSDVLSPNTQNKSSKNCKRLKILQKWQNFDISDHTAFLKWGNHGLFLFIFKKNCRLQRDSNLDHWKRRRAR